MADIHVLEGTRTDKVGSVEQGSYTVAFHIPITTPDSNLTDPNFVSQVPNISQAETDAVKAGTLLEIVETVSYLSSFAGVYYQQRVKDRWAVLHTLENEKYAFKTKFYLTEIAH